MDAVTAVLAARIGSDSHARTMHKLAAALAPILHTPRATAAAVSVDRHNSGAAAPQSLPGIGELAAELPRDVVPYLQQRGIVQRQRVSEGKPHRVWVRLTRPATWWMAHDAWLRTKLPPSFMDTLLRRGAGASGGGGDDGDNVSLPREWVLKMLEGVVPTADTGIDATATAARIAQVVAGELVQRGGADLATRRQGDMALQVAAQHSATREEVALVAADLRLVFAPPLLLTDRATAITRRIRAQWSAWGAPPLEALPLFRSVKALLADINNARARDGMERIFQDPLLMTAMAGMRTTCDFTHDAACDRNRAAIRTAATASAASAGSSSSSLAQLNQSMQQTIGQALKAGALSPQALMWLVLLHYDGSSIDVRHGFTALTPPPLAARTIHALQGRVAPKLKRADLVIMRGGATTTLPAAAAPPPSSTSSSTSSTIAVQSEAELRALAQRAGGVALMIHAKWCGVCTQTMPIVQTLATLSPLPIATLEDVHMPQELAQRLQVKGFPTFFKMRADGTVVDTLVGGGMERVKQFLVAPLQPAPAAVGGGSAAAAAKDVTTDADVLAAGPAIVMVHATWCGACKRTLPLVKQLAPTASRNVLLLEQSHLTPALRARFPVSVFPTFFRLDAGGAVVGSMRGGGDDRVRAFLAGGSPK